MFTPAEPGQSKRFKTDSKTYVFTMVTCDALASYLGYMKTLSSTGSATLRQTCSTSAAEKTPENQTMKKKRCPRGAIFHTFFILQPDGPDNLKF